MGVSRRSGRGPPRRTTGPANRRSWNGGVTLEPFIALRRWDAGGQRDGQTNTGRNDDRCRRVSGAGRDRDRRHAVCPLGATGRGSVAQTTRFNLGACPKCIFVPSPRNYPSPSESCIRLWLRNSGEIHCGGERVSNTAGGNAYQACQGSNEPSSRGGFNREGGRSEVAS
jgi:hypothetical protein